MADLNSIIIGIFIVILNKKKVKMNLKSKIFILFLSLLIISGNIFAQDSTKAKEKKSNKEQKKHLNKNFVDADGDGYNDNAPDHDGDGIPNGLDADYIKLKKRENSKSLEYVDSDGDGINDNLQLKGKRRSRGGRLNKSNQNVSPQNSSGNQGSGTNNQHHEQKGKGKGKG